VMEQQGTTVEELYDRVLVSVGRTPNTFDLGLENTKVELDDKGFIKVDPKQQTKDPKICAIGDVVGGAMLAHKASKEARVAVEVIAGEESAFLNVVMPAVVFTDPELAWCGLTESEAKRKGIAVEVARFPWGASGRALSMGRTDGLTKLILEPETDRLLGVGIVGAGAGDLIGERHRRVGPPPPDALRDADGIGGGPLRHRHPHLLAPEAVHRELRPPEDERPSPASRIESRALPAVAR